MRNALRCVTWQLRGISPSSSHFICFLRREEYKQWRAWYLPRGNNIAALAPSTTAWWKMSPWLHLMTNPGYYLPGTQPSFGTATNTISGRGRNTQKFVCPPGNWNNPLKPQEMGRKKARLAFSFHLFLSLWFKYNADLVSGCLTAMTIMRERLARTPRQPRLVSRMADTRCSCNGVMARY